MKRLKKYRWLLLILVFLLCLVWRKGFLARKKGVERLKVGGTILQIEIADTESKRHQGLSDRPSLCFDCGLLFIFDAPGIYPFWMKRMAFPIDILWINQGEVMEITLGAKVPPKEELEAPKTIYRSKVPVEMVLEVNAGWVKEKGIKVGNKVERLPAGLSRF